MSEYIPAMPPCALKPYGSSDPIPVILWKVTSTGVKPMTPKLGGGLQVFEGKHIIVRDYYSLTEDVNS